MRKYSFQNSIIPVNIIDNCDEKSRMTYTQKKNVVFGFNLATF